jgi:hypothetical protein
MSLFLIVTLASSLYCLARSLTDFRQRRFAWGAIGLGCATLLLLTPLENQASKYDLPPAVAR